MFSSATTMRGREPFDLILLDIEMPALSGIQIVETMREAGTLGRQPVVMITSDSRAEVVQHLLALGVADFLVKPLRAEALIEKLGGFRSGWRRFRPADLPVARRARETLVFRFVFRRFPPRSSVAQW